MTARHSSRTTALGCCAAALSGLVLVAGCSGSAPGAATGSGSVRTETRPVSGFSAVELSGNGDVNISQSDTESLSVTAEDNLLPLLTSEVVDQVLKLGVKEGAHVDNRQPITYQVSLRGLTGLDLGGSGSQVATNIKTGALRVRIAGSGSITTSGTADSQDVQMAGSGAYHGSALSSATATVNSAGSGSADLAVRDRLQVNLLGSGNVTYTGSPQVTQTVVGSGTIQKR